MRSRISAAILTLLYFCGCNENKMILELKDVQNWSPSDSMDTIGSVDTRAWVA